MAGPHGVRQKEEGNEGARGAQLDARGQKVSVLQDQAADKEQADE